MSPKRRKADNPRILDKFSYREPEEPLPHSQESIRIRWKMDREKRGFRTGYVNERAVFTIQRLGPHMFYVLTLFGEGNLAGPFNTLKEAKLHAEQLLHP